MNGETSLKKHSIRMNALILAVSILVLCIIIVSYHRYNICMHDALIKRAQSDLIQSSSVVTSQILSDFQSITDSLHKLALPLEYSQHVESDMLGFLIMLSSQSKHNHMGDLTYFNADRLRAMLEEDALSASEKENIKKLLAGEDTVLFQPEKEKNMVVFSAPAVKNRQVIGALSSTYSMEMVQELLVYPTFDGEGTAILIQADGNALVEPDEGLGNNIFDRLSDARFYSDSSLDQLRKDFSNGRSGFLHYSFHGNRAPVYGYYAPVGMYGLYLYNIISAGVVDIETLMFSRLANSLIFIIILVFIALILFILAMQLFNNKRLKKSQERLLLERERYHTILRHSHGTIWEYFHNTDTMVKSDPDVGIYSGLKELPHFKDILLENSLIIEEDIPILEQFYSDLKAGVQEINAELRARSISGAYTWFSLSALTVYNKDNEPVSAIGQTLNIDVQKRKFEELRDNSQRDSLTRLYNRTAFEDLVTAVIGRADPASLSAFIMIDIDNFKMINDSYGHILGDAVLIEFSSRLSKFFKENSITGRLGGDEFAVFLCEIPSLSFLKERAEKISHIFSNINIGETEKRTVSGSIGISLFPQDGDSFDELLRKADTALYHSKSLGKNCYHIYSPETMSSIIHPLTIKEDDAETAYSHEDHSLIDSSIIFNTVEILFDASQLDISIQMILSLIGNYYDLGFLTIFETSEDGLALNVTYEWIADTGRGFMKHFPSIPMETAEEYLFYRSTPYGLFYTNDTLPLVGRETEVSDFLRGMKIQCLLQCAIYSQDPRQGFVCAGIYEEGRSWTKAEVDSLSLLAKIIGAHILKARMEKMAERAVKRDPLTQAYNFFPFMEEASRLVNSHPEQKYAAVYLDISRFKFINDTYGYSEGDRILIELARILESFTMDGEAFGRVSGDKFVALFRYENRTSFLQRLRQIICRINGIKKTASDSYRLTLILGISLVTDRSNMSVNIDRANIARKSITDRHKTAYAFFDDSMKSRLLKQKEIEEVMEEALQAGEFLVYYQPKFQLSTGKICGAEALVRWNRPGSGLISPEDFISIFEENGFIIELDYYVFDQVCRKIRRLLDEEKQVVPISVNFSRMHLRARTLLPHLISTIREYDIPASLLEIEITESALVDDDNYLITLLNEIHSSGFQLCMDDFGSGLSSLNLLRVFPFDVLKIDREFFQHGSSTRRERIVITNIVKMASELDMSIVSEGVETQEQVDFLKSIHCHIAQGFFFERPMTEEDFEAKYC